MTFQGRVAAITGAASGIGRALAVELARRGCDLALCDVDGPGLDETMVRATELGRSVTAREVDVADREAMHRFAEETVEAHGRVDAIVNNAGVTVTQSFANLTYDDWEWIMGINFWGVVHGTKSFLPHVLDAGDGWIVNVSSVFGLVAWRNQSGYNASKFAVRGMTEAIRQELADTKVTVSCVMPGGVRTNVVRNARFYKGDRDEIDHAAFVQKFDRVARTSPASAATTIADGMERRQTHILVGPDAHVIAAVQRLMPTRYPAALDRIVDFRGRR